jgi:hypothetical protein
LKRLICEMLDVKAIQAVLWGISLSLHSKLFLCDVVFKISKLLFDCPV